MHRDLSHAAGRKVFIAGLVSGARHEMARYVRQEREFMSIIDTRAAKVQGGGGEKPGATIAPGRD